MASSINGNFNGFCGVCQKEVLDGQAVGHAAVEKKELHFFHEACLRNVVHLNGAESLDCNGCKEVAARRFSAPTETTVLMTEREVAPIPTKPLLVQKMEGLRSRCDTEDCREIMGFVFLGTMTVIFAAMLGALITAGIMRTI